VSNFVTNPILHTDFKRALRSIVQYKYKDCIQFFPQSSFSLRENSQKSTLIDETKFNKAYQSFKKTTEVAESIGVSISVLEKGYSANTTFSIKGGSKCTFTGI